MAASAPAPFAFSDRELIEISARNPGFKIESMPSGELIMSPTGILAAYQEGLLYAQLNDWARDSGAGLVFSSSAGFRLPDHSVRSPDASWLRRERWAALTEEQKQGFASFSPDAVFELARSGHALPALREKMRMYCDCGARIAVLLDPVRNLAEIYRPGLPAEVFLSPGRLSCEPEMPGFLLDCPAIFYPIL